MTLRLGTRGSALALAQSRLVASEITRLTGQEVELVEIVTAGDTSSAPVQQLGVGVFVSALRDALLAKEIDLAVHSYKDLPTAPVDGLVIAAVPPREDPRDALIARDGLTLTELPDNATIGTGALRRVAQIAALGLPLRTVPIRGNVDTRLRKVAEGELDAVVLARAGLARLGRAHEITEILDPMLMLPAPAQGALAVESRGDFAELLAPLDDRATRGAVAAERALLATLEAGCSAPVAALAEVTEDDEIYLRGAVISTDGRYALRLSRTGTLADAAEVGRLLAADLLEEGADHVLGKAA
ncbi:hydroxymethylbilane synthase [Catelliglobosispora koreensis]|uniref:hydroxymethylbilane synthase n=1 Tax=Catelliglobosispora koreensis TaxID=129052 RepID=UPI000365B7C8|nr:hydroxymethylbilane synthase [Catelliglobosispora koreensis]